MSENLFVRAMERMLEIGELEKVAIHLEEAGQKSEAKQVRTVIEAMNEYNVPFIPLLMECRSVELLQDAICFMVNDMYQRYEKGKLAL